MIVVDTWISRCRFKAQVQEVLVESAVPGQRCLLETIEGADEAADVVWMLLALKTFSLRNEYVLIKECLKKGVVVMSESHTMILLVEVGNKGTGIVVCCQCMRRGRLLVWLTVACVGVDSPARAGFCCGYLCGCTPGIEKMGSSNLKAFLLSCDGGRCLDCRSSYR